MPTVQAVSVGEWERERESEWGKRKRRNEKGLVLEKQRDFGFPICRVHHQKQIRNGGKWPTEIVSEQQRTMEWFKCLLGWGGHSSISWYTFTLLRIQFSPRLIDCVTFTPQQSTLFVGTHQDGRRGSPTLISIQFAPPLPRLLTVPERLAVLLRGQWHANDKINMRRSNDSSNTYRLQSLQPKCVFNRDYVWRGFGSEWTVPVPVKIVP